MRKLDVNTQIKNGKVNKTHEDKIEKVAITRNPLNHPLYADLLITIHYTYDRGTCKVSNMTVKLEQEGWGFKGLKYDNGMDVRINLSGVYPKFSIDFRVDIGLDKVGAQGVDVPLPFSQTKLYTVYGEVDPATGKAFSQVYPRGF